MDESLGGCWCIRFGTRGSQVQILPLRPAFNHMDQLTGPDMGNETQHSTALSGSCAVANEGHEGSRRKKLVSVPARLFGGKLRMAGKRGLSARRACTLFKVALAP